MIRLQLKLGPIQVRPEMLYGFHYCQQLPTSDTVVPFWGGGGGQRLALICDELLFAFLDLGKDRFNSYGTCICVEDVQ